jgi:hypothetical protein
MTLGGKISTKPLFCVKLNAKYLYTIKIFSDLVIKRGWAAVVTFLYHNTIVSLFMTVAICSTEFMLWVTALPRSTKC